MKKSKKGKKMVVANANARPLSFVPMLGERYKTSSLKQQGVLDGAECDHIDLLVEKFYEVTKYVSYTEHLYLSVALIFSKKQFNKLPEDVQKALLIAGKESIKAQRNAMELKTREARDELYQKQLVFNKVEKKLFREKAKLVYQKHSDRVGGMSLINQIVSPNRQ